MYIRYFKRAFDIAIVVISLPIVFPLCLLLSMLVLLTIGKPVLFKQNRPGLHGKSFTIYKFRSMDVSTDENGALLPDDKRLTKFGRFLRSTSLDELPELYNVLKGDMSIIGPRPLLTEYLNLYNEEQARRHEVKPGITGWAQINGRNVPPWEKRLEMDTWYVDNVSFILDLKIFFVTIIKVLTREGINQEGRVTVEYFKGTSKNK